jgi:hypothetical protein
MFKNYIFVLTIILFFINTVKAQELNSFEFQNISELKEMENFIKKEFQLGDNKEKLRNIFIVQGNATLKIHPNDKNIEKYIYDINLCQMYIWRWNISADYNTQGLLSQIYLNGNPVFSDGMPKRVISKQAEEGQKASIYKSQRPRPEASKGEKSLGFLLFDRDSNIETIDDQMLIGSGPSRSDPINMGNMIMYSDVDPWRSIFDFDEADTIYAYQGGCKISQ